MGLSGRSSWTFHEFIAQHLRFMYILSCHDLRIYPSELKIKTNVILKQEVFCGFMWATASWFQSYVPTWGLKTLWFFKISKKVQSCSLPFHILDKISLLSDLKWQMTNVIVFLANAWQQLGPWFATGDEEHHIIFHRRKV